MQKLVYKLLLTRLHNSRKQVRGGAQSQSPACASARPAAKANSKEWPLAAAFKPVIMMVVQRKDVPVDRKRAPLHSSLLHAWLMHDLRAAALPA